MSGWKGKTTTALNLRVGPGTGFERITTLNEGVLIDILEQRGKWFHVAWEELEGYVHGDYVKFPRAAKSATAMAIRAEPGLQHPVVVAIYEDTQLLVFDRQGGWCEVVALGLPGYALEDDLLFPQVAQTTGHVNLRTGPSTDHRILTMLPPGVQVHIWEELGAWVYIADTVRSGYLHTDFVKRILDDHVPTHTVAKKKLAPGEIALEPHASERITLPSGASALERQMAAIWNRLGGLLAALSAELGIDPAVAVAVLAVESGGRAFGPDGRMIIRFENQVFYDKWGKDHEALFRQHFTFDAKRRWTGHQWRPSADEAWRPCHGSQAVEWEVFEFAAGLNDTAAKYAISMGGPQIMGFNYATLGYDSVQAMFDAFAAGEAAQVAGLFSFIRGRRVPSAKMRALQVRDFEAFARYYNGPGQAVHYGSQLQERYDALRALREEQIQRA